MNIKRKIAGLLIGLMFFQVLPTGVLANPQHQVEALEIINGISHEQMTSSQTIRPNVMLSWTKPRIEEGKPGTTPGDKTDPNARHDVDFYQVSLLNRSTNERFRSEPIKPDQTTARLENLKYGYDAYGDLRNETFRFESGTLYTGSIIATHIHMPNIVNNQKTIAPALGRPEEIHFVTDFNTQAVVSEKGLDVSWEYIPGADYRLTYVEGAYATKQEIIDSPNEIEVILTAEEAKNLWVQEQTGKRVHYTLENVKPKQRYSMYVELADYHASTAHFRFEDIIKNDFRDDKGPKVVQETTLISIDVYATQGNMVEIYWGDITWAVLGNDLEWIEVWARDLGNREFRKIAQKNAVEGIRMDSIIIDEPKVDTEYMVKFKFKNIEKLEESNHAAYYVELVIIPPLNPKIPDPYSPSMTLTDTTKKHYLVKGDLRPITDPTFIQHTFHGQTQPKTQIQLAWDAPHKPKKQGVIDYDLYYDIWVTDDVELIREGTNTSKVLQNVRIQQTNEENLIKAYNNTSQVLGMKTILDQYIDRQGNPQPLKRNHTYYIKMVAKRQVPKQTQGGRDYMVASQPTIVSITIDKDGHISRPPVIGKPPLRIKDKSITQNSMTVEWLTRWHEVVAKNPEKYDALGANEAVLAEMGSSIVYLPETKDPTKPPIRYTYLAKHKTYQLFNGLSQAFYREVGGKEAFDQAYYERQVVLEEDIKYEAHVLKYSELEKMIGTLPIEVWMKQEASQDTTSGLKWQTITPKKGSIDEASNQWIEYDVTQTTLGGDLEPNTRYAILLRAYRIVDGKKLIQSFPSYVIGTTETDFEGPEPTPITPELYLHKGSETDHSFEVYWSYNKNFDYEIRYSIYDDYDKAQVWPFTVVEEPEQEAKDKQAYYFGDGEDAYVKLTGLFPHTTYHVWIRAKQKKGTKESAFSTPVTATTKDLEVPAVPTGLGPASKQSLIDYDKGYDPITKDAIAIEWTKNKDDQGLVQEGSYTKAYEYDVMFADNPAFEGGKVVTVKDDLVASGAEIIAKNLVRFTGLIANRPYYVQVRARVVVTDQKTGREVSKTSAYSRWVRLLTKKSDDEYDGGDHDHIVIYDEAIEESYHQGVWEWEIVDEQFVISQIVKSQEYFFEIGLEKYKDQYTANKRRIILPVSVVQALIGQEMGMRILTEVGVYEIPTKHIAYGLEKAHVKDRIIIELDRLLAYDLRDTSKPYPYIVETAEAMSLYYQPVNRGRSPITTLDGYFTVFLKLPIGQDLNRHTYVMSTYHQGRWQDAPSYTQATKNQQTYIRSLQRQMGIYSLYRVDTYHQLSDINYGIQQLLTHYHIQGLGTRYKAVDVVHSQQYIRLLMSLAMGQKNIDLTQPLSNVLQEQAKQTGIYSEQQGYVTQEMGIHGIVRLYELRTGYRIQPVQRRFEGVDQRYMASVQKAYTLGWLTNIEPKKQIAYGQLATWLLMTLTE